jgi:hypothetical protein
MLRDADAFIYTWTPSSRCDIKQSKGCTRELTWAESIGGYPTDKLQSRQSCNPAFGRRRGLTSALTDRPQTRAC